MEMEPMIRLPCLDKNWPLLATAVLVLAWSLGSALGNVPREKNIIDLFHASTLVIQARIVEVKSYANAKCKPVLLPWLRTAFIECLVTIADENSTK